MLYDIIIIGGGPGGYQAAMEAVAEGLTVALIEKKHLGGVCLNEGCIPTKTLLYSSKLFYKAMEAQYYGIYIDNVRIELGQVIERKNDIVCKLRKGLSTKLHNDLVDIFDETGLIKTVKNEIQVVFDNNNCICGKNLIIASGSRAFVPDIKGISAALKEEFAIDSSKFLNNTVMYKKVVIIGCGIIGIEFASFLANIGIEAVLLDNKKEILEEIDEDVRKVLIRSLIRKGVKFKLGVDITEIDAESRTVWVKGEQEEKISCDKVIICTGRIPNIDGFGVAEAGIAVKNGAIITDDFGRTSVENVYAIGDVNGRIMLAHTAYAEAKATIQYIQGKRQAVEYHLIPRVIYSHPEAAWVGMTENKCRDEKLEYAVKECSMRYSGKFMVENEKEQGICKLIWDKNDRKIIGGFLIGDGASEIIITIENMIRERKTIDDVRQMIFPHPSIGEVIQECV